MTDLADIRQGLAVNLESIDGLVVSAYVLPTVTPPAAEIEPGPMEYDLAMGRGLDMWNLTVRVYVGSASTKGAQLQLDTFLASSGASSVKAAIETDKTLGGIVSDLRVTATSGYRVFGQETGGMLIGCEWSVEVMAIG